MSSLPQLRTVGDKRPPEPASRLSTPAGTGPRTLTNAEDGVAGSPYQALFPPRLHPEARKLLEEALRVGLLDPDAVQDFFTRVGNRISSWTEAQQVADALVYFGNLTSYQRTRLVSGQTSGLVIGNYRVLDRLGGGTVSVVFLAEHRLLKRRVAIKVLSVDKREETEIKERLFREARILAELQHPHVVSIYDAGELEEYHVTRESRWYLILELVPNSDVEQFVYQQEEPISPGLACTWIREAAEGLHAVHLLGITHRDVKPSNMLLTMDRHVKLSDFGLARNWHSTRTPQQVDLGTLGFASPEQVYDATLVGAPSDVYGLGVTLFWLLSGQLPYPQDAPPEEILKVTRSGTLRSLKDCWPGAPEKLSQFVGKMLARDPNARPTAEQVARFLMAYCDLTTETDVVGKLARQLDSEPEPHQLQECVHILELALAQGRKSTTDAQKSVLAAFSLALATRAGEPLGHQRRISEYVRALARHLMHLPSWMPLCRGAGLEELVHVAAIHDLGLLTYPDAEAPQHHDHLDNKNPAIKLHPERGLQLLNQLAQAQGDGLPFLRLAWAIVGCHHERWDGCGYPNRIAGESIPRAARLVTLADTYDALRAGNPQTPGLGHDEAVEVLNQFSGKVFDPAIMPVFTKWAWEWDTIFQSIPDHLTGLSIEPIKLEHGRLITKPT